MVLVLAVVPPAPAEGDAEVHPVAGQVARRVSGVLDPGDQRADPVAGEDGLEVGDQVRRARRSRGARPCRRRRPRRAAAVSTRSTRSRSNRSAGSNVEEPERLPFRPLGGRLDRPEVAVPDAQRPREQEDVGGLAPWVESRPLRRDLVPHGVDAGTAHTGVASERAQRDAAGGRAHLRQHPQRRGARPGPANRCGPAAREPDRATRSPSPVCPRRRRPCRHRPRRRRRAA